LQDTKSAYVGSLPLGLESNAGVSRSILNIERYQLGLDYLLTYANRIGKITADMILESAQNHLNPEHFVTISAGPNSIEV
jgi:zinc protease